MNRSENDQAVVLTKSSPSALISRAHYLLAHLYLDFPSIASPSFFRRNQNTEPITWTPFQLVRPVIGPKPRFYVFINQHQLSPLFGALSMSLEPDNPLNVDRYSYVNLRDLEFLEGYRLEELPWKQCLVTGSTTVARDLAVTWTELPHWWWDLCPGQNTQGRRAVHWIHKK